MRTSRALLAVVALAAVFPATSRGGDRPEPRGHIEFAGWLGGIGLGYSSLDGTLELGDERYPISIVAMEGLEVGLAYVRGSGDVYDVPEVRAVEGRYRAFLYSATPAVGGHGMRFENGSGVYMETRARSYGLSFTVGPGSLQVFVHGLEQR